MNFRKRMSNQKIYDIQTFINENRLYLLTLIIGFYVMSRLATIISIIASFEQISSSEFWTKMIFQIINIIILMISVKAIIVKKYKVVIAVIIYNMIANIIVSMFFLPENVVVALIMFFLQLITIQIVFYLIFRDGKINLITMISSFLIIALYYMLIGDIHIIYDEFFSRFLFVEIIYGITIVGIFLQILNMEYHNFLRFIEGLLYVDYNVNLPNEKQLVRDFEEIMKSDVEVNLIGIYIVNLLSLNRQIGYDNVQRELLKRIKEMSNIVKKHSKLYKWEGPVFLFSFEDDNEKLTEIIKQIESILNRPVRFKEYTISFKINALGTKYPTDGMTAETLMENLRIIKYSYLRDLHKNENIYWFSTTLLESSKRMLLLEKDIHGAIDREEISIVIQPKISIKEEDKPAGGEVLARWNHPKFGFVSPLEFIPLIEHEGLMDKFTTLIIKKTEKVIETYQKVEQEKLELAVNISASSLVTGHINDLLIESGNMSNLVHKLELELTENILFELNDESKKFINDLKKAGYKIAIDDFGTGFSNFEYLQELEIDILKIDKRFIDKMLENGKSELVVNAIIKMAHTLGVEVVAEGVETVEQRNRLKELGCDYIQGYYYAKPMIAEDFIKYMRTMK